MCSARTTKSEVVGGRGRLRFVAFRATFRLPVRAPSGPGVRRGERGSYTQGSVTHMHERPIGTARKRLRLVAAATAVVLLAALPSVAAAKKHPPKKHHPKNGVVGAMYAETNNGGANQLLAFDRYSDGHLKLRQAVNTGGKGGLQPEPGCDPPGGCPLLDAQGEVQVTNDGKLVFAVNAGSNTISSFTAGKKSVKLADQVPSGGVFPNSITIHGNVLYVLNTNSKNIAG